MTKAMRDAMAEEARRVNKPTVQERQDELERIIDRDSLAWTLEALAAICDEKADHIRASYQDEGLAKRWHMAALQLSNRADSATRNGL